MGAAYTYDSGTSIGGRSENQDNLWTGKTKYGFVGIVCDGMGGGKGGKMASDIAIDVISDDLLISQSEDAVNAIYNAIQKANFEIFRQAHNNTDLEGMGTTVAMVLITKDHTVAAHVGDSRIYQIRSGKIIHRSNDHSVVFRMLKDGILTSEEQARNHPQASQITRALGLSPAVDVEVQQLNYEKGDYFFICSDGINGELTDTEILNAINKEKAPERIVERCVKQADSRGFSKGGGHDNATCICIQCNLSPSFSAVRSGAQSTFKESHGISYTNLKRIVAFLSIMLLLSFLGMFIMKGKLSRYQDSFKSSQDSLLKSLGQLDSLKGLIHSLGDIQSSEDNVMDTLIPIDESTEVISDPGGDSIANVPPDSIDN